MMAMSDYSGSWLGELAADLTGPVTLALVTSADGVRMAPERLADVHVVEEHAIGMSGGSKLVRPADPEINRDYPLPEWIRHQQRHGGKVFRRRVIVLEDWQEVPRGD